MKARNSRNTRQRLRWRIVALTSLALIIGLAALFTTFRRPIPPGMLRDVKAGLQARRISDPDERLKRYLELRYGPLSEAANRQKIFEDFFDPDRIKALHLIVQHSREDQRQANVDAMAKWVEGYRQSMTDEERAALSARFQSPEGQARLRSATALYNSQGVHYRGMTAPVISQLLRTISTLQAQ